MSIRKTFNITDTISMVNYTLLNSGDNDQTYRQGQIHLLETILHQAGRYNGFQYLTSTDMEQSNEGTTKSVGIKDYNDNNKEWNFKGTDHTRIRYYT